MLPKCPSLTALRWTGQDPPPDPLDLEVPRLEFSAEKNVWEQQLQAQITFQVGTAHTDRVSCCKFCFNDCRYITCSFDGSAILWDLLSGATVSVFGIHSTPLTECCISPDNRRLFTSSWDKSLKAWDIETGKVLWSVVHSRPLTCCDVSFDGKYVVCGSDIDNGVYIKASESGEPVTCLQDQHHSTVTSCRFNPDGQHVASVSCDKTARIWDMLVHRTTMTLKKHRNVVSDCCFSQMGNVLCTASWDRTLLVWDISLGGFRSRGPLSLVDGHEGCISSCALSKDATLIVAGSYDQTISIWDTAGLYRKLVLKDHKDWVMDVAISSDNKWILSACKDSTVRVWNIERMEQIPAVKAEWREHGEKVVQCTHCGKPFSRCHKDDSEFLTLCVFCRQSASPQNSLPTLSPPPQSRPRPRPRSRPHSFSRIRSKN
ncbi:WD repeat-containing protein 88-like [Heterodontus francisci]|uniref:WD repeat-containing protein 88-like n=1 Tax=Heterodontus francisci TaxID=7792 RepID=UPI00355C69D8